jgi:hypothetical protein
LIVVGFLVADPIGGPPTISDTAGNTWNVCNPVNVDATHSQQSISWYALANGTASTTITVQSNTGSQFCSILLDEFTAAATISLDVAVNSADGATGTPTSPTLTPTASDCLIWAAAWDSITAVGNIGGSAATKGADDTQSDWSEYRILSGGSGVGITAAFAGSGAYAVMAAAFKETGTPVTAAITGGTAIAGTDEADIRAGGKTIVITLTGDTFISN